MYFLFHNLVYENVTNLLKSADPADELIDVIENVKNMNIEDEGKYVHMINSNCHMELSHYSLIYIFYFIF